MRRLHIAPRRWTPNLGRRCAVFAMACCLTLAAAGESGAIAQEPSIEEAFTDPQAEPEPEVDRPANPFRNPADGEPKQLHPEEPDSRPGVQLTPRADEPDHAASPRDESPRAEEIPAAERLADESPWPSDEYVAGRDASFASEYDAANGDCFDCGTLPACGARPASWISGPYLRAGYSLVMGDDLLEENSRVGYAITGGYRQPLGEALAGNRVFLEAGGSYLSAFGETTRLTNGQATSLDGAVSTITGAFSSRLTEVRRSSAHAALGWYWGDPIDDSLADPQLRFASRLGGRVGSARGRFLETQIASTPVGGSLKSTHADTDMFGGLFFGTEVIVLNRQTELGHFQWTIDAELANDFLDFKGFHDGGLGTASVTFGFMLAR